jgi:hypothetical protein
MNAPQKQPTGHKPRSAEAKDRATAIIAAWACIGVAAIAAAVFLLF